MRDSDLTGQTISSWRLTRVIGTGGFGRVYEAEHLHIQGKRAAIKILAPHLTLDDSIKQRFLNEASAASRAEHDNIVQIYDGGITADGVCFCVMELLRGKTLSQAIGEGPLGEARTIRIGLQVASALVAAHAANIVHRDLKPDNIFLAVRPAHEEFVKVLDFGIAKLRDADGQGGARLTATDMMLGTPAYMSPEQWMALPDIDGRADIYMLGIILYECLTGKMPFDCGTYYGWQQAHLHQPIPEFAPQLGVDPALEQLIRRMVAKQRQNRPQQMTEVYEALLHRAPTGAGLASWHGSDRAAGTEESTPFVGAGETALLPMASTVGADMPKRGLDAALAETMARPGTGVTAPGSNLATGHGPDGTAITDATARSPRWWPAVLFVGGALSAVAAVYLLLQQSALALLPIGGLILVRAGFGWSRLRGRAPEAALPGPTTQDTTAAGPLLTMLALPGGTFMMGSLEDEEGREAEEVRHAVRLSPFALASVPVTRRQWFAVMVPGAGEPDAAADEGETVPMTEVSWHEAIQFCNTLSLREGYTPCYEIGQSEAVRWNRSADGYRLPTEAEWEYACRAGTETRFFCGNDEHTLQEHAWFVRNSAGKLHPVGTRKRNGAGFHDMHGLVWEWCWDVHGPYEFEDVPNPTGVRIAGTTGVSRVVRGGSFGDWARALRSAKRGAQRPASRLRYVGFRCARGGHAG